jgi:hypothetical protein
MGKDKRKKDGSRKQADPSLLVDAGSEPKAQQGPRNRASREQSQKDGNKNVDSSLRDISDYPPSQSDSKPGETPQEFSFMNRA